MTLRTDWFQVAREVVHGDTAANYGPRYLSQIATPAPDGKREDLAQGVAEWVKAPVRPVGVANRDTTPREFESRRAEPGRNNVVWLAARRGRRTA